MKLVPKSIHNMFRLLTTFTPNADGLHACENAYILAGATGRKFVDADQK